MNKNININNFKNQFNGKGTYYLLFGETGNVTIEAKTWEDLAEKYMSHMKKCPRTTGFVHCMTKIG